MQHRIGIVGALVASCLAGGCKDGDDALQTCIKRGIAYYNEIGSYRTLSSGEDAEKKVTERCQRSTQAFPE
jgi:hypothetical protein